MNEVKNKLKKIIKGDIQSDEETLVKYSRDASLFTVRPKLVVFPKDSEDVKNLVKWVSQKKFSNLSITARSAGTDMTGGPLNDSIILDFTRYMNKFIRFSESSELSKSSGISTITVQPGMYYRDFEKIVSEKDLMLPSYPASKSICALGGMFANNSGGEKTLKYGKTERYVVSAKVVLSDGEEYEVEPPRPSGTPPYQGGEKSGNLLSRIEKEIYDLIKNNEEIINNAKPKVSKNSAGYAIWNVIKNHPALKGTPPQRGGEEFHPLLNKEGVGGGEFDLNQLFVGSQGTLGIVTEITFKLVPIPENTRLAIIYLNDFRKIPAIVNETLKYNPESLEAYDDKTLKIAIRFFTSFLKGRGILESIKFAWSFWPDLFMLIKYGFPKLVMLVELAGSNEEIGQKYSELKKYLNYQKISSRISKSKSDTQKYWDIRHESFNLLRKHVKGKKTVPFIDDVIVRPEFLDKFLPELEEILAKYPELEHTIAGHPGDGNFHIIPLVDINDTRLKNDILKVSDEVYDLVAKYNGSITAEHNDGIIRTPFLSKMFNPEILRIFAEIKHIFDPQNIFNPGKKVGGTLLDIAKYL